MKVKNYVQGQWVEGSGDGVALFNAINGDSLGSTSSEGLDYALMMEYAKQKLERKKLNLIIANDVSDQAIGFNSEQNAVTVVSPNQTLSLPQTSKTKLARELIDIIAKHYHTETTQ